jgi:hypothetical protein
MCIEIKIKIGSKPISTSKENIPRTMKIVGACYICGGPAMNTCSFCGQIVCRECYIPEGGSCVACKQRLTGEDKEFKPLKRF